MTGTLTRALTVVATGVGLLVYGGCSDPAPPQERSGTTDEAISPAICATDIGTTTPWLLTATCGCPYTGDLLTECSYEFHLFRCMEEAGYAGGCARLQALPIAKVVEQDKSVFYFEDLDLNTYFPRACPQQRSAAACIAGINAMSQYAAPPVSPQQTHHCNTGLDPCAAAGSGGTPNPLDIFDPCSTSNCHM
jgi:hypothetical protein